MHGWKLRDTESARTTKKQEYGKMTGNEFTHVLYDMHSQWLKCNGTQGNAVPLPPIYGSKRTPTSDCYNARKRYTTIVGAQTLM